MASGLTTVIGFAALILMRFKIGPDMGLIMAKAILFQFGHSAGIAASSGGIQL